MSISNRFVCEWLKILKRLQDYIYKVFNGIENDKNLSWGNSNSEGSKNVF